MEINNNITPRKIILAAVATLALASFVDGAMQYNESEHVAASISQVADQSTIPIIESSNNQKKIRSLQCYFSAFIFAGAALKIINQ